MYVYVVTALFCSCCKTCNVWILSFCTSITFAGVFSIHWQWRLQAITVSTLHAVCQRETFKALFRHYELTYKTLLILLVFLTHCNFGSYHSMEDITTPTNTQCISTVKKENHEWDEGGNESGAPVNFQQSRTLFLYTSRLFRNIRYVARRNHHSTQRRPPKRYNRPAESFQASSPLDHFKVEYYKALQL